jgi:hypothetical protein
MESRALFDDICKAFASDGCALLLASGIIHCDILTKEAISELREKEIFIIPRRTKEFDKKAKEEFVYEIADTQIAEQFFEATTHASPKKSFEELILEHNLNDSWERHKRKFYSNALLNWMAKCGISLPGQKLVPEFKIDQVQSSAIPDEMRAFVPIACSKCENSSGFEVKYFKSSLPCENLMMEQEAENLLKSRSIENFHFLGKERKELIAASQCPKCASQDLEWDFH